MKYWPLNSLNILFLTYYIAREYDKYYYSRDEKGGDNLSIVTSNRRK